MTGRADDEPLDEAEATRRFRVTLRKMLNTHHQPHETAASKKHKAKRAKSPRTRTKAVAP